MANRLLLLNNGSVAEGTLHLVSNGYLVERPNGRMLVTFDNIRFVAKDLHDAYEKQRATLPADIASAHIALARWCVGYQLHGEARVELEDALRLEPDRELARRMLRRLDAAEGPAGEVGSGPPETPRKADGDPLPEARSLSNLSREAAIDFTRTIQPILVNNCGNASCHGTASDNGFRLYPVRVGSGAHRVYSERNLATAMQLINAAKPYESTLLVAPSNNHNFRGRTVFHGEAGAAQFASLREWVRVVADEMRGNEVEQARRPSAFKTEAEVVPPSAIERETNNQPPAARAEPKRFPGDEPRLPGDAGGFRNGGKPPVSDADIRELIRVKAADEFDPEEFNRLNGTGARGVAPPLNGSR